MSQAGEPSCMTGPKLDSETRGTDPGPGTRPERCFSAVLPPRTGRLFSLGQPHADGNTGTGSAPSAPRGTSGGRSYWPRVTPVTASALACFVEGANPAGTRRGLTPCPLLLSLHRPGPSPVTVPTRGPGRLFPRTEGSCCRRPPDHRFVTRCHATALRPRRGRVPTGSHSGSCAAVGCRGNAFRAYPVPCPLWVKGHKAAELGHRSQSFLQEPVTSFQSLEKYGLSVDI